jgi:hypothetical protein
MANDFSSDSRVKALWRFENNLNDARGGNHLTDVNTVGFTSADKKEGTYAADFEKDNAEYGYRDDVDLDAGFPSKSGDALKKISVCFWCKPESYVSYSGFFTKWNWSGNKRSLEIQRNSSTLKINCGHTDGSQYQNFDTGISLWNGEWYHVAVCIDGKTEKSLYVRVFRASNATVSEYFGTLTNELWVGDPKLVIGASDGGGSDNYFDGLLDEMVVFNELLSALEIDTIRSGTYTGPMPQARGVALGSQVGYHLAGFLQADALGAQVAYSLIPEETYVRADAAGVMALYAVAPPPKRVFPVPNLRVRWQSHPNLRKFPVVS